VGGSRGEPGGARGSRGKQGEAGRSREEASAHRQQPFHSDILVSLGAFSAPTWAFACAPACAPVCAPILVQSDQPHTPTDPPSSLSFLTRGSTRATHGKLQVGRK